MRFFPLSSLLWGFALTFNWSYLPVQICGSDTCHVFGEDWGGSRGDKREWSWSVAQSESESALVSKDGHVWPKTQTAPHLLISAQKHLWVADGEASAHTLCNVEEHWEGSKLPLNSWAVGRDGYTGENKRKSEGEGKRSVSRDSPLVKPTWLKQSQASPSPS